MLIRATQIAKAFGPDEVLSGATFHVANSEKVALVGRNGSGKSTLVKILTGNLEADRGSYHLARGAKIGYLRQENSVGQNRTVLEEAEHAVHERTALRKRLRQLEKSLEDPKRTSEQHAADLEEFALLSEHFLSAEAYSVERDLKTVLQRMGFSEGDFSKPTSALSGGEKTRLAIAGMLLQEPDLLVLDEPTNHLDLQATEWLEGWIRGYHGAVLLVSHDRRFLEATAERVLELAEGVVKSYPGPFAKYLELRAAETERLERLASREAGEIAKLDEYVRRFMNSQRTAQARGRLKQMNRLIETQTAKPKRESGMKAGFGKGTRTGDLVVQCEALTVGFVEPELCPLFSGFDWTVRIGERWGVVGENGAGKSTLVKTILGQQQALAGSAKLGSGVVAGYFSQDADDLDPALSPFETLVDEFAMTTGDARNLLGRFLISGDDAFRPIRTLSGGERNKLSLARLTALHPNLLVLDEPTNHLDMASREALAAVLADFGGTMLLVSHDRWLLDQVSTHTLDVRRTGVIQFGGSYSEYRNRNSRPAVITRPVVVAAPKEVALSPRELSKEIVRVERAIEVLEVRIGSLEGDLKAIEGGLSTPASGVDVRSLSVRHGETGAALRQALAEWESAGDRLEALQQLQSG